MSDFDASVSAALQRFWRECDWIGPLILAVTLVSIAVLRFWMIKSDKSDASAAAPLPTRIFRQADDPSASARSDAGAAASTESTTSFVEEFESVLLLKTASKLPEAETRLRKLVGRASPADKKKVVDELLAVMKQQGKLHECAALLEDMLQHLLTCHGPHNIRTLKHQIKLATMYQRCGRMDDAEATFRHALSSLQRHHSADNAAAVECLSSLGSLLKQLGRLDEASPLLSSAFDGCRRVYGPDHSKTIVVQNNFAFLLMDRAVVAQNASDISSKTIFDDAERMMRDALSRQLRSVGESDPITLQTMHNLAALLDLRSHDSDEAIEFMRRAVRCRSASLGLSNAHTIASQHGLVKMLLKRGKDGVSEAEEVMQSMITASFHNIDEWVKAVRTLVLHLKGKAAQDSALQAKDLLLQSLQRQEQTGSSSDSIAQTLDDIWDAWFVLGDMASAVNALRRCIKFKTQLYGAENASVLQDQSSLAALLEKNADLRGNAEDISEAEQLYRHVARVQREVLGSLNCSSCLAMYNLGAFLLVHRSSQHDEAASLLRSAHSGWSVTLGKDHEDTQDALRLLQQCRSTEAKIRDHNS